RAQAEGEEVEEERPVLGGVEGDQAVVGGGGGQAVDLLEGGRLAGLGGPVVDDFRLDGPFAGVELDHGGGALTRKVVAETVTYIARPSGSSNTRGRRDLTRPSRPL